jgi:hypothetical protein
MTKSNNEDFICDFLPEPSPSAATMNDAVLSEEQIAAFYRDGACSRHCDHAVSHLLEVWRRSKSELFSFYLCSSRVYCVSKPG